MARVEDDTLILESEYEWDRVTRLLDNPTAKQIIRVLSGSGREWSVLELARAIGKAKSTVSEVLKKLRDAGILEATIMFICEGANIIEPYKLHRLRVRRIRFKDNVIELDGI